MNSSNDRMASLYIESCVDCGHPVLSLFMAQDDVWAEAGYQEEDSAHAVCLAARLGRALTIDDFSDAACNDPIKAMRKE